MSTVGGGEMNPGHSPVALIGSLGGAVLRDALSKSADPAMTITEFQQQNALKLGSVDSAITLLEQLNMARSDLYLSIVTELRRHLLERIRTMEAEKLGILLAKTFPFIDFPELRPVPIALISRPGSHIPEPFLRSLAIKPDIMRELPLHVKSRVWELDEKVFFGAVGGYIEDYVKNRHTASYALDMTGDHTISAETRRHGDQSLRKIITALGTSKTLFNSFSTLIAEKYEETQNPLLLALRMDIILSHKDVQPSALKEDSISRLAWALDAALKYPHLDSSRLTEIQKIIAEYRLGDISMLGDYDDEADYAPIPLPEVLQYVLSSLSKYDTHNIFALPVPDDVPGYREIISEPMDLSTMQRKAEGEEYKSVEDLESDFQLMINNCLLFNEPDTIYFKHAKKLQSKAEKVFEAARLMLNPQRQPGSRPKRRRTLASPNHSGQPVLPREVYMPALLDVCFLLGNPFVQNLLIRSLVRVVNEAIAKSQLPKDHPLMPGIVQLLTLGSPESILRMKKLKEYVVREADPAVGRVFCPLMAHFTVEIRMVSGSLVASKGIEALPPLDPVLKELMNYESTLGKVMMYYAITMVKRGAVFPCKLLFQNLWTKEELLVDDSFCQSLVTAVLSRKERLTASLRQLAMDNFMYEALVGATTSAEGDKSGANVPLHVHEQVARMLSEWTVQGTLSRVSSQEVLGYAQGAIRALDSVLGIEKVWQSADPFLRRARDFYEKIFSKHPDFREKCGAPAASLTPLAVSQSVSSLISPTSLLSPAKLQSSDVP